MSKPNQQPNRQQLAETIERNNESSACIIVVFHGRMVETISSNDEVQIISEDLIEGLRDIIKPVSEHVHVGWWHYWTMPGCMDKSDFMGPYDTEVEAMQEAIETWIPEEE